MRGQNALFGGQDNVSNFMEAALPDAPPWSQTELSKQEKASIGFYLSVHPLDEYGKILRDLKILNLADYENIKAGDRISLAGIVSGLQIRHSKKGNRFCLFRLEDRSSGVKCLMWSEAFTKYAEFLRDDELLIVEGKIESAEGQEITLILDEVKKLNDAVPLKARSVLINLAEKNPDEKYFEELFMVLSRSKGSCEVYLNFSIEGGAKLKMYSQPLRIQGSSRLEAELKQKNCSVEWIL
jgi:DNA polymerase-3 subunit alpha